MLYGIVSIIILLSSLVFAMLGLGGGMVYVPILMWPGLPVKEVAIPLGLLLTGLNTLLALIPFAKNKLVDWKGGLAMAEAAFIFAPVGAYTSKYLSVKLLLLLFAIAVVAAGIRMIGFSRQPEPEEIMPFKKRSIYGSFVGGLLGIGGGFIIAPILMWMGYKTKQAAATAAFVVTFSSLSGYLAHAAEGHMNWTLTIILVIAVIIGSQFGAQFMSTRSKPKWVKQLYAAVLIGIAIKLFLDVL